MGSMITQERPLGPGTLIGLVNRQYDGTLSSRTRDLPQTQVTTSYRSRTPQGSLEPTAAQQLYDFRTSNWREYSEYDHGHPFETIKRTVKLSHPYVDLGFPNNNARYRGPLLPNPDELLTYPSLPSFNESYEGSRVINDTVPTHPAAGVSNMLGELYRDGLPGIPIGFLNDIKRPNGLRDIVRGIREGGSQGLNVVFAWQPLLSDVEKLLKAVIQAPLIMEQYARDSGRSIRRKRKYPATYQTETLPVSGYHDLLWFDDDLQSLMTYGYGGNPQRTTGEIRSSRQISFSGAYTYYLANDGKAIRGLEYAAQQAQHLLGLGVTPEVLWNLAPWSWLSDWIWNFGDALSAASAFQRDGLVLRYGYLMCHDVVEKTYSFPLSHPINGNYLQWDMGKACTITLRTERKMRVRATPFGFGLDPASFDARQIGILALLGMSNAPRIGY